MPVNSQRSPITAAQRPSMPFMWKWLTALVVVVVAGVASIAEAARPPTGSIVGPLDPVTLAAVSPSHGDDVVFLAESTAGAPRVSLQCWQADDLVLSAVFPVFTLASSDWTSGAADCTATAYVTKPNGHRHDVATVDFTVAA